MAPQTESSPVLTENSTEKTSGLEVKEILYEGYFYDVTDFAARHPGGKIIEFYFKSGENATLAIQQFHNRSINKVLTIMKSFKRRPAKPEEIGLSKETSKRHEELTKDFQKLHKELESEGYFEPSIPHTIYRISELFICYLLAFYLFTFDNTWTNALAVIFMGVGGSRCGWFMHEGGHHSVTGNPKADKFIQSFIIGHGVGLSASWWRSQHNRHHAMPQRLKHDVDLNTLPLIAFNTKVVKPHSKAGKSFLVQYQATLFMLLDAVLVMFFWKLYLCPRYAWKKGNYVDLFFMISHYGMVIAADVPLHLYIISFWIGSSLIFLNFSLSHSHLPVTDEPIHWVEYSLNHTVDIEPSFIVDWWMGYLNYQVEHHLFPTMPQFRQRAVAEKVKALARKHNIPYRCISYKDAVRKTFQNLEHVSQELREMH